MADHELHIYGNVSTFQPSNYDNNQIYENTGFTSPDIPKGRTRSTSYLACIDIGTSYSTYCFAPVGNPTDISADKNWTADKHYVSHKTPTVVFRSGDRKRTSIGFVAHDNFYDEDDDAQGTPGLLLNFKHKIRKDDEVKTVTRKRSTKAIEILLKHMKQHVLDSINKKYDRRVTCEDISWLIPVPSRWDGKVCNLLAKKVKKAGMINDVRQLTTVKESHAAFTQCITHSDRPPRRVVVINAGGWDIEVTSFAKVQSTKRLQYQVEFDKNIGFGGNYINDMYLNYLRDALGDKFLTACQKQNPVVWQEIRNQFELVKQGSKPDSRSYFKMQLSQAFGELFRDIRGQTLSSFLKDNTNLTVSKDGKLVLSDRKMKYFYNYAMGLFRQKLMAIMRGYPLNNIDKIFLTGGFGSSSHLQAEVRKFFRDTKVIIPEHGNLCVTKGCLLSETGQVYIC